MEEILLNGGSLSIIAYNAFLTELLGKANRLAGTTNRKKITLDVIDELLYIGRKVGLTVNFDLTSKTFEIKGSQESV